MSSLRVHYWSKSKKKNCYKSCAISKFNGDREATRQYLEDWKNERLAEEEEVKEEVKEELKEEIKEEIKEEVKEEIKEEIKEEVEVVETPKKIKKTKFKLELAPDTGTTTAIYGSSKSGKTYQLIKILKDYYGGSDIITLLIAENIHSKIYDDVPNRVIKMDYFDSDLIKKLHNVNKKCKNKYKFCIVLDDMILMKNNTDIMSLILTMRNANFSTVLLFQSIQSLAKTNRQNLNNVIFRRQNNMEAIELAMKNYLGGYKPFYGLPMEDKINIYREATADYGFIYLNALSDDITFH